MTEQTHYTVPPERLERIQDHGWEALPNLLTVLINAAMRAECDAYLGADRYECSPDGRSHANGFKPKTVQSHFGNPTFTVPKSARAASIRTP